MSLFMLLSLHTRAGCGGAYTCYCCCFCYFCYCACCMSCNSSCSLRNCAIYGFFINYFSLSLYCSRFRLSWDEAAEEPFDRDPVDDG